MHTLFYDLKWVLFPISYIKCIFSTHKYDSGYHIRVTIFFFYNQCVSFRCITERFRCLCVCVCVHAFCCCRSVTKSCLTPYDPMYWGSFLIFQQRVSSFAVFNATSCQHTNWQCRKIIWEEFLKILISKVQSPEFNSVSLRTTKLTDVFCWFQV